MITHYQDKRKKRQRRIRVQIHGTASRPRLSIFRSNRHIGVQLIDDIKGETLIGIYSTTQLGQKGETSVQINAIERAKKIGKELALKAKKLGIKTVVFDRAGYRYHGQVKGVAEGAREGGLAF